MSVVRGEGILCLVAPQAVKHLVSYMQTNRHDPVFLVSVFVSPSNVYKRCPIMSDSAW